MEAWEQGNCELEVCGQRSHPPPARMNTVVSILLGVHQQVLLHWASGNMNCYMTVFWRRGVDVTKLNLKIK